MSQVLPLVSSKVLTSAGKISYLWLLSLCACKSNYHDIIKDDKCEVRPNVGVGVGREDRPSKRWGPVT